METFWSEHLGRLCKSLIAQTDRIKAGSEHTGIKGTSIEVVIRRTLKEYLPHNFEVGTGQVANTLGKLSPQMDVLIYDANTFPRLAVNEDGSVVLCSECVHSTVECKASWDTDKVLTNFSKFKEVESVREGIFGDSGSQAGYFALVIEGTISEEATKKFNSSQSFVGLYSLKAQQSWFRRHDEPQFLFQTGNALEIFLNHVMGDCMEKGIMELGALTMTNQVVRKYFGWDVER